MGLKLRGSNHSSRIKGGLKSDQNGIEIILSHKLYYTFKELKSDQNGIEIWYVVNTHTPTYIVKIRPKWD